MLCVFFFTLFVYFLAGIGSEEVQPFSMSLEAEMMLEQLKERHLRETEVLQNQLESKVSLADENLKMYKLKKKMLRNSFLWEKQILYVSRKHL